MSKNTTQIKATVVREKGGPFNIETLTLEAPRRDDLLVKVVATQACATQIWLHVTRAIRCRIQSCSDTKA
jgi:aryl-alcohol dehydrogenase